MAYTYLYVLFESLLMTYLYRILGFKIFRAHLDAYCKPKEWYKQLSFKGKTTAETQEELKYGIILAVHHLFSGSLMLAGCLLNGIVPPLSGMLFARGLILEIADDIHDSLTLLLGGWPYSTSRETANALAKLVIPHHLFGLLVGPPVLVLNLHYNIHTQVIGTGLLLAGGVQLALLSYQRTLHRLNPKEAWYDFFSKATNFSGYFYIRFFLFPYHSALVLFGDAQLWAKLTTIPKLGFVLGISGMTIFNVLGAVLLVDGVIKSYHNAAGLLSIESLWKEMKADLINSSSEFVEYFQKEVLDTAKLSSNFQQLTQGYVLFAQQIMENHSGTSGKPIRQELAETVQRQGTQFVTKIAGFVKEDAQLMQETVQEGVQSTKKRLSKFMNSDAKELFAKF